MTTAEQIADRFNNDGSNWTDANGTSLHTVLATTEHPQYWLAPNGDWIVKFSDGSCVIVSAYWDIGQIKDGHLTTEGGNWCEVNEDGEPVGWTYRLRYTHS